MQLRISLTRSLRYLRLLLGWSRRAAFGQGRTTVGKVFCVGFNKTGTSSLTRVLADMGYQAYHRTDWADISNMSDPILVRHDAFADGELAPVEDLAAAYPDARFVLNTRALLPWLVSRVAWVEHRQSVGKTGSMREELESLGLHAAVDLWVERRDQYHRRVLNFFAGRPDSPLVIDFTTDDDALNRLQKFVGRTPATIQEMPHINPSSEDRDRERIRSAVIGVLEDLGMGCADHETLLVTSRLLRE